MTPEQDERICTEVQLLESMYPGQVEYSAKGREVSYSLGNAQLRLRLPDGYLDNAVPDVVSASVRKCDVRDRVQRSLKDCYVGEELLDSVISSFNELVESAGADATTIEKVDGGDTTADDAKATIIVWLHHLLNTNKRKQCLAPPAGVSGITKPGYPGVLVFSGPANSVHEHVNELKSLNWAAFQLRLESEEEWTFTHGYGVVEVEAMKDVVAHVGDGKKEQLLEALKIK